MAKKKIDPEERASWVEARRRLAESLERSERLQAEWVAYQQRRKERLRRWSFGLLGR